MKCNQCGKEIPKTNQQHIKYNGKSIVVCGKHYAQYLKHGKFLDADPRTCFDTNEYEIVDEGVWIYCLNRKNEPAGKFLIDREDLERVISKKWRFWKGRYFTGNFNPISIHVFLTNPKKNEVVDHIDGNPANNKKSNLRVTKQGKNVLNKALMRNNKSGIAGVSWDKERNKWIAEIRMDGIKCYLGRYTNIEDAVYVRYQAELKLFKEFRSTRNDQIILKYVEACSKKNQLDQYVDNRLHLKYSF